MHIHIIYTKEYGSEMESFLRNTRTNQENKAPKAVSASKTARAKVQWPT